MNVVVKYTDEYSLIPLIKFNRNGQDYYALIDTGSESTLIDGSFVESEELDIITSDKTRTLTGLVGKKEEQINTVQIDCTIDSKDNVVLPVTALLSDLSMIQSYFDKWTGGEVIVPILIGSDTLTKLNAKIDYENKLFTFDDDISGQ